MKIARWVALRWHVLLGRWHLWRSARHQIAAAGHQTEADRLDGDGR